MNENEQIYQQLITNQNQYNALLNSEEIFEAKYSEIYSHCSENEREDLNRLFQKVEKDFGEESSVLNSTYNKLRQEISTCSQTDNLNAENPTNKTDDDV